jgi:hypothetical protein
MFTKKKEEEVKKKKKKEKTIQFQFQHCRHELLCLPEKQFHFHKDLHSVMKKVNVGTVDL